MILEVCDFLNFFLVFIDTISQHEKTFVVD